MSADEQPLRVSLVATPDAQVSPLSGLYETFSAFRLLSSFEPDLPRRPFDVEIVAPDSNAVHGASGLPLGAHRTYNEVEHTDIAIVPLMMVKGPDWVTGRYPGLVEWLCTLHDDGAVLASACTGILLLAETGLLEGHEATIHWAFAPTFQRSFPNVPLRTEETLITAGSRREFIMTGGVMSWHDLALHLIARYVGPTAAQAIARLLMLEWHGEGQAPYMSFSPELDHEDALIRRLQKWLRTNYAIPNPVEEMVAQSGIARRSLERRFQSSTGHTPIAYVQHQRVAEAKRRLERTDEPVEQISYDVGYENTAFFRRIFKRITRLTPGAYRRKFRMPDFEPPTEAVR